MPVVLIGGDVCPAGRSMPYFINGNAPALFNDFLVDFQRADLSVVNLEAPFIERPSPIEKSGPVLSADSACINGLKNAHISSINLANNHILDHGGPGLLHTLQVCRSAGLDVVGAGENLAAAQRLLIQDIAGFRVAIFACAEREFSIATASSPGAAPLDIIDFVKIAKSARSRCDYLLVLLHAGKEHYPFPTPRLQKTCRFMIEEGACAVICQHSHCPGCYEQYQGGHIVYGQGNLIFDIPGQPASWYEGYLVRLTITSGGGSTMQLIPYTQSLDHSGAKKMPHDKANSFLSNLAEMSKNAADPAFVATQWADYCRSKKHEYLGLLRGFGKYANYVNKRLLLTKYLFSQAAHNQIINIFQCETHREILQTIVELDRKNR